ncbi:DUF5131 family protein [Streptomyces sp. NPDC056682]|uniref:DUF5131 family protein n=1 Tax=Streptomyces sp. NPDC056682 TaxID=3345909 RepID=UPI00367A9A4A
MSNIEWTEQTWNPTTGCDRTSPGCDRCYALTMAKRLKGMGQAKYQTDGDPRTSGPGFGLAMHEDTLADPLHWTKPRRVFVNSMSDLFHASVTDEFIAKVFAVMALTPQHTYQVLTKRHGRMRSLLGNPQFEALVDKQLLTVPAFSDPKLIRRSWPLPKPGWPLPNVWLGVSVEDQHWADIRVPALVQTPAAVRFLSCEPLLGPVDLTQAVIPKFHGIHWAIVGGESGPGARPMDQAWAAALVKQCQDADTAVFVKQLGSVWARENGASDGKGGKPEDWPAALRVREYPTAVSEVAA